MNNCNFLIGFRKVDRRRGTRHLPPEPVAKSGQTLRKNSQKKFTEKIQNLMREITKIRNSIFNRGKMLAIFS